MQACGWIANASPAEMKLLSVVYPGVQWEHGVGWRASRGTCKVKVGEGHDLRACSVPHAVPVGRVLGRLMEGDACS